MKPAELSTFCFPTMIRFGAGARQEPSGHLRELGFGRLLLVTDQGLMRTRIPGELLKLLPGMETDTFSEIWGNPVASQVQKGVDHFHKHKAQAIVALGGGAAVDVAKAIALMVHHPGQIFDYEDGKEGSRPIDQEIPYLVALPTTSGTGSEVGRSTVISDDRTKIKKIIFSPRLLPKQVFADPELTLDLPPAITAATGMDALAHVVEAYLAKGFQPLCDGVALEGLRLIAANLPQAVADGKNIAARSAMLAASIMGAVAFQKGLGVTHSCAHALSTVCDLHHGLANGIMIPYAMKFNLAAEPTKFARLASAAGLSPIKGQGFVEWLHDLKKEIGIPAKLNEAGVKSADIPALINIATKDVCHQSNPRPVSQRDFEEIFTEALS